MGKWWWKPLLCLLWKSRGGGREGGSQFFLKVKFICFAVMGQSLCLNFCHVLVIKKCHDDKWKPILENSHLLIRNWTLLLVSYQSNYVYKHSLKCNFASTNIRLTEEMRCKNSQESGQWIRKLNLIFFSTLASHRLVE